VTLKRSLSLGGGNDATVTDGDLQRGWDLYTNADVVDVSLLPLGDVSATVANYVIQNVAEVRKDCVVFLSPSRSSVVNNAGNEQDSVVAYRNTLTSSSYAFMDGGWKYQYDKYNDVYRFLPLNGDIAGCAVRTDTTRDPWFSIAGYDRGQIKNIVKLAWNPTQAQRDVLYKSGVNPVVSFPGDGTILYGDKTLQSKPSAFDRINVRRLFIVLEKAIARASKFSLFEFNDEFTRAQFVAFVEPFLRDVQGRRGIFDFRVVCDTTNNTPEVIDSNRFVGDIYIKPARSINFIQLNFVAVRTGVSFDEIVGKF
jgi:phage tail sheath protein FI